MSKVVYTAEERQTVLEGAVRAILVALGEDATREGLIDTPKRVAKMYTDIYSSCLKTNEEICEELNVSFNEEDISGDRIGDMVIVKDIPFYSTCEHHLVPFYGMAHVGYIPSSKVIGLSKIARLVHAVAKRPQLQERITNDVAECLQNMLGPVGVMVVIEAQHLCMAMRGVRTPGATTVTSATRGSFREDEKCRNEFLSLINKNRR